MDPDEIQSPALVQFAVAQTRQTDKTVFSGSHWIHVETSLLYSYKCEGVSVVWLYVVLSSKKVGYI